MLSATNAEVLTTVAQGLGPLLKDMVFVGGAIPELYIPEGVDVAEVRQTDDVDCIIEIAGRIQYAELEEKLRKLKFENDQKVICRWHYKGITVDVMPTDQSILGFTNQWYKTGIANAIEYNLSDEQSINILTLPFFIACKLEALFNRGMADLRTSKDFEDIVFLLNYIEDLPEQIEAGPAAVKTFIQEKCKLLTSHTGVQEAIFCVLPSGDNGAGNVRRILLIMVQVNL